MPFNDSTLRKKKFYSGNQANLRSPKGDLSLTGPVRKLHQEERNFSNGAGFTLLELVIVLSIFAILASAAVSTFVGISYKAISIQERMSMRALGTAVLLYKAKYDAWPDGNLLTWSPFTLLENPPPNTRSFPPAIADLNNRNWYYQKDGTTSVSCGITSVYWRIWCPHASNTAPWVGLEWAYMVVSGIDAWSAGALCPPNIHSAGQVLEVKGWRTGH